MVADLSLVMSLSREEFLRLLPAALGPGTRIQEEEDGVFRGEDGERHWTLRLAPLANQRLASVVLPRYRVEIHFDGFSEVEAAAFMARFHRGFQRGGG